MKEKKQKPKNTQELWTTITEYHMHNGNIRRQRKRKGRAEISEVLMTENFSKLMTKPNHSSRKLRAPSMMNTKKSTPRHMPFGLEIMFNQLSASPGIPSFGCSWENQLKNDSVSQETSACSSQVTAPRSHNTLVPEETNSQKFFVASSNSYTSSIYLACIKVFKTVKTLRY